MFLSRSRLRLFATFLLVATPQAPSLAADASSWDGDSRGAMRLIAGGAAASDQVRAGVEIRLAPGWKTYWRYPGDSGVPPQFDFSASENVKSVAVAWPAPQRIDDSEGVTIGYKDGVVFPVRIEPKDEKKPIVLRLKLDYAICEKLCIPAQGQAELTIAPGRREENAALAAFEKKVPHPRALGADAPLSIKGFRRDDSVTPARVVVDLAAPAGAKPELFAEGPTPDWALPVPDKVADAPNELQRFSFALDGLPPGASAKGAAIKLTAVSGADAIETTIRLD